MYLSSSNRSTLGVLMPSSDAGGCESNVKTMKPSFMSRCASLSFLQKHCRSIAASRPQKYHNCNPSPACKHIRFTLHLSFFLFFGFGHGGGSSCTMSACRVRQSLCNLVFIPEAPNAKDAPAICARGKVHSAEIVPGLQAGYARSMLSPCGPRVVINGKSEGAAC